MKAIASSIVAFLFFVSLLFFAFTVSQKRIEYNDVLNLNIITGRVFEKYVTIENAILDILNKELRFEAFAVDVTEGDNFNTVRINVTLPSQASDFKSDLQNFQNFAQTMLNETNMVVELNLTQIQNCFPLTINPYNISFGTIESGGQCGFGSGQRDFKITPTQSSPQFINSYDMMFTVNSSINQGNAGFSPAKDCTGGTFNWTVTVVGTNQIYGPTTQMIDPSGKCVFSINAAGNGGKILQVNNAPGNDDPNKTLVVTIQPSFQVQNVITLNLTDVPGGITVGLPPQAIKVKETIFQIERNDTITIR